MVFSNVVDSGGRFNASGDQDIWQTLVTKPFGGRSASAFDNLGSEARAAKPNGDYLLDEETGNLYGPKLGTGWPTTKVGTIGPATLTTLVTSSNAPVSESATRAAGQALAVALFASLNAGTGIPSALLV